MFIDEETLRETLSAIRSLGGLWFDMMVVVQRAVQRLYGEKRDSHD